MRSPHHLLALVATSIAAIFLVSACGGEDGTVTGPTLSGMNDVGADATSISDSVVTDGGLGSVDADAGGQGGDVGAVVLDTAQSDSGTQDSSASVADGGSKDAQVDGETNLKASCAPCDAAGDCAGGFCHLAFGAGRCAAGCKTDDDCEASYHCAEVKVVGGSAASVCVPSAGAEQPAGTLGSCACPGQTAGEEVCDAQDNDCDGQTDEGGAALCDDANPCTTNSCDAKSKSCKSVKKSGSCDDGDACTSGTKCSAGQCGGGKAVSCKDDGNPCTKATCTSATGCQQVDADGTKCAAASGYCAQAVCQGGKCVNGTESDCNDNNPCTTDSCDKAKGACAHKAAKYGTVCDDGDACTEKDACAGTTCKATAISCNDGNSCTTDGCDTKTGCTQTAKNGGACSDGDICTSGDSCAAGKCQPGVAKVCGVTGPCNPETCNPTDGKCISTKKTDGKACDDGNVCTSGDACAAGLCVGKAVTCDDKNPCTDDSCDPGKDGGKGGCKFTPNTFSCDDGNACSDKDACVAGACKGGAAKACDDGNPCTAGSCDPKANGGKGGCVQKPSSGPCDDGKGCTTKDACKAGSCAGVQTDCDDSNPCTDDACDPNAKGGGGCVNSANTKPCDDGDACTGKDTCKGGKCVVVDISAGCDDGNSCTDDTCDKVKGCVATPNTKACDDGSACTSGDVCAKGQCAGGKNTCECSKSADCATKGTNKCDGPLACVSGKCAVDPAKKVTCADDGNPCTNIACDPTKGVCATAPLKDGAPCDADGSACTSNDACAAGKCAPGPTLQCDDKNPCTDDACNAKAGCVQKANTKACDDGSICTTGDACASGVCTSGKAKTCGDGNICTDGICDAKKGCGFQFNTKACNDGDVCTEADACKDGKCLGGKPKACDDGNPCTTDSCDKVAKKCVFTAHKGNCDDGNKCTSGERCFGGKCGYGKKKYCGYKSCHTTLCDPKTGACSFKPVPGCGGNCTTNKHCKADSNVCTLAYCNTSTKKCAKKNTANGTKCSDGYACTKDEACKDGKCTNGKGINCDDGNKCTTDLCDAKTGKCASKDNTYYCDDGSKCTYADRCKSGKCLAGTPKTCDDYKPCTTDSCDAKTGKCVFTPTPGCSAACKADKDCPASKKICQVSYCYASKECRFKNVINNSTCDDGNPCSGLSWCWGGKCLGGNIKACDDGNICTDDACDAKTGKCGSTPNKSSCNDGDLCTAGDTCGAGKCVSGTKKVCNDNNKCTTDSCDPKYGKCVFKKIVGCGGYCGTDKDCTDDTNPCRAPYCHPSVKKCYWKNEKDNTLCDDGTKCTAISYCKYGKCVGANQKNCDDGKTCTIDSCDAKTGSCTSAPKTGGYCVDGSKCTYSDTCQQGKCVGKAKVCNDKNACTTDSCDAKSGYCKYTKIIGCGGYCAADKDCKQDGNPCSLHYCYLKSGKCYKKYSAKGTKCNDGNPCTVNDNCKYSNGKCYGGGDYDCDDKNPCTTDKCDPKTGKCLYVNNTYNCNDGDACTYSSKCIGGKCVGGSKKTCSDNKTCTDDFCDSKTGACSHKVSTKPGCCASSATCKQDGNACTVAYCDTKYALCKSKYAAKSAKCDDGDPCTTADTCKYGNGKCYAGGKKNCDDKSACTLDLCDPKSGKCFHVNKTGYCDDGDKCTGNGTCKEGKCLAGAQNVTCATKKCHTVACDATSGQCVYKPISGCK